jgi:hypothetical protein
VFFFVFVKVKQVLLFDAVTLEIEQGVIVVVAVAEF